MNDPLSATARWGIVTTLAAVAIARPEAGMGVGRIAVLGLAGFALLPVVGWLRTLWFVPVACGGLAAWAAAVLLHGGQSAPVALAAASGVGAAVGAAAAGAVRLAPEGARAWWSLLLAAGVWAVALPQSSVAAANVPLLFGVELATDRALGVTGVLLVGAALWATTHLARTRAGRQIAAAGSAADLALRCGADLRLVWLRAGAVSGLFAAWAGFLMAVDVQNIPPATHFSPAAAVVWLAAPLLGGPAWASGVLLGAVAVGGLAAVTPIAEPAVAGLALVAAVVLPGDGLVGLLRRRGS